MLCMLGDALERLTALGVPAHRLILIGGGSASSAVQQAAADLFASPVVIPRPAEYVALGAARQAAWALSGDAQPPVWPVATLATREPRDHAWAAEVRGRFADARRHIYGV
jgi:xylulokinase